MEVEKKRRTVTQKTGSTVGPHDGRNARARGEDMSTDQEKDGGQSEPPESCT